MTAPADPKMSANMIPTVLETIRGSHEMYRAQAGKLGPHAVDKLIADVIETVASIDAQRFAAESRAERAEAALRRCADESDYCYLCDRHPSDGHADDCILGDRRGMKYSHGIRPVSKKGSLDADDR